MDYLNSPKKYLDTKMLKCLKCRVVGQPPLFAMPPPPPLPAQVLADLQAQDPKLAQLLFSTNSNKTKRCLKLKSLFNKNDNLLHTTTESVISATKSNLDANSASSNNQLQSLILFSICFIFFLIVLGIALLFLYKLFHLRKKYNEHKKQQQTAAKQEKLNSYTSKNRLMSLYDLAGQQPQLMNSTIFYNQLFESTRNNMLKQKQANNSSDLSNTTSNSSASSTLEDNNHLMQQYQHYLQAVPNQSNLIENHLNYRIYHQTIQQQQQPNQISEYDEINSQSNYNTLLFKSCSSSSSSTTSSTTSSTKPLIFNPLTTTIIQPVLNSNKTINRQSAGFIIVNNNSNNNNHSIDNPNSQSTVNELINSNFYYVC